MSTENNALQALSYGLLDGGCNYVTNFPGFHSHDLFYLLGGKNIVINEKVAYEMAYGGCLAGARTVVTFKSFGLNVAADPFLNSLVAGVNGGLVIVLTEDVEVEASQCRQDSRTYRDFFGGLWFEPNSLSEAYNIGYNSFVWSEQLDIPIVIRLTNQFFKLKDEYTRKIPRKRPQQLKINPKKYIMHPINSRIQRDNLKQKNMLIDKFIENFYRSRPVKQTTKKYGCIVFGNCHKELINYSDYDILYVLTYPVPVKLIKEFVRSKKEIIVLEQGNDYGTNLIRKILYEKDKKLSSNTGLIPNYDNNYINWHKLEKLFMALQTIKPSFVVGDLGQFTKESTNTIQACLCLGSSIPIGIGLVETGVNYPFCITGDAAIVHAGLGIINEIICRNIKLGIIIIDNGGSQSTGGQMPLSSLSLLPYIPNINIIEIEYKKCSQDKFIKLFKYIQDQGKTVVVRVKT